MQNKIKKKNWTDSQLKTSLVKLTKYISKQQNLQISIVSFIISTVTKSFCNFEHFNFTCVRNIATIVNINDYLMVVYIETHKKV